MLMRTKLWCALLVLLAGCGGGSAEAGGEVLVFAAASLTEAFGEIEEAFVAANPGATVTFNFAGSQTLATQINEGAPADVFASANQTQMDVVGEAGEPFIANVLQIAVEPGNPLGIETLEDLARPDVTLVMAAEEVPAGQYAREALDAAGVTVDPASLEQDVRAVLSRVSLGEADAGIVYASDVASAGDEVSGVEIPDEQNVPATYPIATLPEAPNPEGAEAFVAFVRSEEGQTILAEHGFTRLE